MDPVDQCRRDSRYEGHPWGLGPGRSDLGHPKRSTFSERHTELRSSRRRDPDWVSIPPSHQPSQKLTFDPPVDVYEKNQRRRTFLFPTGRTSGSTTSVLGLTTDTLSTVLTPRRLPLRLPAPVSIFRPSHPRQRTEAVVSRLLNPLTQTQSRIRSHPPSLTHPQRLPG